MMPPMASGYVYRSWWGGRTLRMAVLMVVIVLLLRIWWGWKSSRLLAAQLSAIRVRGEPASIEDLVVKSVPDAQNAYEYQVQASGAHVAGVDSPQNSVLQYPDYPPYTPRWHQLAEQSEQKHRKVFALARQARQFGEVQTHQRYASPLFATLLPGLNRMRTLANTLADGAVYQHLKGSDAEAMERVRDTLHVSRSVRHDEFLVCQMVAMGIDALAMNAILTMAPALQADANSNPAARKQAQELIAQLLDEREAWEGLTRGIRGERVADMDYVRFLAQGTWVIGPLADMQRVRTNPQFEAVLQGTSSGNYADAAPSLHGYARWAETERFALYTSTGRYSRFFSGNQVSLDRYSRTHFRVIGDRRMAAVSLAVRLYRVDTGNRPATLDVLVPKYLPALPADPFRNDGRAVGYRIVRGGLPDGGDRPMLFVEEGPELARTLLREPMYSYARDPGPPPLQQAFRQYRDLSRFVPPLPPETVDDDPAKPGAPGEDPQDNEQPRDP